MRAGVALVRDQIERVLTAWGMPQDMAAISARLMAETDRLGVDSHGISMLPMYEQKWRAGILDLTARPRVVREGTASALLDGMGGLGHPVSRQAMELACDKALSHGVGAVSVRNSHHFGAAGVYARLALARGLVGLVASSAVTLIMVPTRGAMPRLGTNPLAFAAPGGHHPGLVLDMATTTVAGNKVKVYDFYGKPLPEGWAVDGQGRSVTDASQAMEFIFKRDEGGLTPLGGTAAMSSHKGYGLALMAQTLGGTLGGSALAALHAQKRQPGQGDDVGHFFLALNPDAFREAGSFEDDMDELIDTMRDTPAADPQVPVLVPGDLEAAEALRRDEAGVPISRALDEKLRAICERSGARYVLGL
ncbi:Ldh family oxidoreductase [Bordetella genomosp. 12]|uniref:Malate dehydrogenase n=1 Tax=Bordetella genomosp. 12 TaxID=463035 RepID=A0A261VMV3_9BORD|nr:Ldh family oxidoreductase [Bordetella genomosp. 12]OZI75187.1 malate dehydrogenase [Bordetella genomosp. 12]